MTEMSDGPAVDLAAWLRSLPLGTVLLDKDAHAWQVRTGHLYPGAGPMREFRALMHAGTAAPFDLGDDDDTDNLLAEGPFTVLWMPPVGGTENGR